jgi:hypothetical protein
MEIKLLVITHKKDYGSISYYSQSLNDEYRKGLEAVNFSDFEVSDTEIREAQSGRFYIYFMNYFGGKDEYGRAYRSVVATIFPFQITKSEDKANLEEVMLKVKKDIVKNLEYFLTKSYFADIKGRRESDRSEDVIRRKKEKKMKIIIITGVVIILLVQVFLVLKFKKYF